MTLRDERQQGWSSDRTRSSNSYYDSNNNKNMPKNSSRYPVSSQGSFKSVSSLSSASDVSHRRRRRKHKGSHRNVVSAASARASVSGGAPGSLYGGEGGSGPSNRIEGGNSMVGVMDPETGEDRTPAPLSNAPRPMHDARSGATSPMSQLSSEDSVFTFSQYQSMKSVSSRSSLSSDDDTESLSSRRGADVQVRIRDEEESQEKEKDKDGGGVGKGTTAGKQKEYEDAEEEEEGKTEMEEKEELKDKIFEIELEETETIFIYEAPQLTVANEDEAMEDEIRRENNKYQEMLHNKDGNADRYVERAAQTLNTVSHNKTTQIIPDTVTEEGIDVSAWEIHDDYEMLREAEERENEEQEAGLIDGTSGETDSYIDDLDGETSTLLYEDGDSEGEAGEGIGGEGGGEMLSLTGGLLAATGAIPRDELRDAGMTMHRVLLQNRHEEAIEKYKGFNKEETLHALCHVDDAEGKEMKTSRKKSEEENENDRQLSESDQDVRKESHSNNDLNNNTQQYDSDYPENNDDDENERMHETGEMELLWRYNIWEEYPPSQRNPVNGMCWNPENPDVIAGAYGWLGLMEGGQEGKVLCWNAKNVEYPERVFSMPNTGFTSVAFSRRNPHILAAGCSNGSIAIFDVRKHGQEPILESTIANSKHTGTVWDVQWVERPKEQSENLVSIGGDGRVRAWVIRKDLEGQELMRLKRVHRGKAGMGGRGTGTLVRESEGMSIDFDRRDGTVYLVGTEEGVIHCCSRSYNEYLDTYTAHSAPVYRVRHNPFHPDTFLSCSADWTVRVWSKDKEEPVTTIEPYSHLNNAATVTDVCWSDVSPSQFLCTTATGFVGVFDTAQSTVEAMHWTHVDNAVNCGMFGSGSRIVVSGTQDGSILLHRRPQNE
eukprot:gb/GECH01014012.1/.p1 GENE.gb/GECH01014012.1/~~gb/GECH01014012.1/.p1  ORF type:complete len:885 (+),score=179.43 gb/GECH01014012.1/:1-2655(+)